MFSKKAVIVCAAAAALGLGSVAGQAATVYSQGFETDNAGWDVLGGQNDATRTASGDNGITAASGSNYYGVASGPYQGTSGDYSAMTNWGGYSSTFGTGYTTSLDIYLKYGAANDMRFDWDNAINKSDGTFLRDFVFNVGFYNDTDSTGAGDRFVISASNNANQNNSYPKDPGRTPFTITDEGWYTFQNTFYEDNGFLADDLSIKDANGTTLHTWTLNTTDAIATTGGNRYGMFIQNDFSTLGIDNATLTTVPEPSSLGLVGLAGLALLARRSRRRIA